MKRLIFAFIILLIAVGIGFLIHIDPGYVLVVYHGWSIESSLWVAVGGVFILFLIIYFLIRLIRQTQRIGSKMQKWGSSRKQSQSRKLTNLGLCAIAEGNWHQAEQYLIKSARDSNTPLINYLAAAKAAQEQKAYDRRDNYLRRAIKTTPGSEIAVGLTQAELQVNSQQWEQALATLKHLNQLSPNHVYTLKLLYKVYLELQDWHQLQNMLPSLRKYDVLNSTQLEQLTEKIYIALLMHAANSGNVLTLNTTWEEIPRSWRYHPSIVIIYTKYLIDYQQDDTAIHVIEKAIKKQWNPKLVEIYGKARGTDGHKQLVTAEHWFKKHPNEPELLIALGRLALRQRLIGKAKEYLEACIHIKTYPIIYQELASIYEVLGDKDKAILFYRKATENNL